MIPLKDQEQHQQELFTTLRKGGVTPIQARTCAVRLQELKVVRLHSVIDLKPKGYFCLHTSSGPYYLSKPLVDAPFVTLSTSLAQKDSFALGPR